MTDVSLSPEEVLRECPEWYHSIELAPGVVSPGRIPLKGWRKAFKALKLPDLRGKSVLDIGAYDGFFSFEAESHGAARVVALDHYVWNTDMVGYMADWRDSKQKGTPLPPPHHSRHWHPDTLPGRRPFDHARRIRKSRVEPVVGDFMTMDISTLGQFDVVLFLGVLYHLEEPLTALRRIAALTAPQGVAVVESEAMEILGAEEIALCEFFPGQELNNDPTNWWAPNATALMGLCRAAGFGATTLISARPTEPRRPWTARVGRAIRDLLIATGVSKQFSASVAETPTLPVRYRALVHARRARPLG